MTTAHTGDRTTGCDTCAKNDYLSEIITDNNWESNEETMTGALEAWVDNAPTYYKWEEYESWISDFEEAYAGEWDSEQEFADNLADDMVTPDFPEMAQLYFDYEKFARDLFMGDYWSSNGYVFRSI